MEYSEPSSENSSDFDRDEIGENTNIAIKKKMEQYEKNLDDSIFNTHDNYDGTMT